MRWVACVLFAFGCGGQTAAPDPCAQPMARVHANGGTCLYCSDQLLHCDGSTFAPCPSATLPQGDCAGWDASGYGEGVVSNACFVTCTVSAGATYVCDPNERWEGDGGMCL